MRGLVHATDTLAKVNVHFSSDFNKIIIEEKGSLVARSARPALLLLYLLT